MLVGWAPGMSPLTLKPGNAKLIKKGSVFVFQMHYTTNGTAAKDRTSVALWFAKGPIEKRVITRGVSTDPRTLVIPAGDANFESRSSYTFPEDIHILSFMPHMHVRGKDFEYKLVLPDGTSKILLRVPKYDFNWQISYSSKRRLPCRRGAASNASPITTIRRITNSILIRLSPSVGAIRPGRNDDRLAGLHARQSGICARNRNQLPSK